MPTEKPKIIFVADNELLDRLDDFRFENRINSRLRNKLWVAGIDYTPNL